MRKMEAEARVGGDADVATAVTPGGVIMDRDAIAPI
jgi:hypothetical protein